MDAAVLRVSLILLSFGACLHTNMAQNAPGFSNLKEGAALNEKQENSLPDISGRIGTEEFSLTSCRTVIGALYVYASVKFYVPM